MIEFKRCPIINGVAYASLEEAQVGALAPLFALAPDISWSADGVEVAEAILRNRDTIIDILTTDTSSRPKARKINGGIKKRKPKPLPIIDAPETAA